MIARSWSSVSTSSGRSPRSAINPRRYRRVARGALWAKGSPRAHQGRVGPLDVRRPAEPLEQADQQRRRVELETLDAVTCGTGERVVRVVPRLAHREQCQPGDVAAPVVRAERPAAEAMADRVDRPGDVVRQADA